MFVGVQAYLPIPYTASLLSTFYLKEYCGIVFRVQGQLLVFNQGIVNKSVGAAHASLCRVVPSEILS